MMIIVAGVATVEAVLDTIGNKQSEGLNLNVINWFTHFGGFATILSGIIL